MEAESTAPGVIRTEGGTGGLIEAQESPPEGHGEVSTDALDQISTLAQVVERLRAIEDQLREHGRRAAHREAVIDRLHAENQELRAGLRRTILDPVVGDLIRLFDALSREARRLQGQDGDTTAISGGLIHSFAGDVELILDRCGIESFSADPGDRYRTGEHHAISVLPADNPERDGTLAELVSVGFRERDQGRVRRPLQGRFYRYRAAAEPAGHPDAEKPTTE
jgi:molecular chaperone GrpE (heat shock protein)